MKQQSTDRLMVFSTALGWMAIRTCGSIVRQLTFGHRSPEAAAGAVPAPSAACRPRGWWQRSLAHRLTAFAEGVPVDFRDILIDPAAETPFRRTVLRQCREIPYGQTLTYGELAAMAGSPGAARAVGNCMAGNPVPLLIPCHRVVSAQAGVGQYSAPGGTVMKRRLLHLEARSFAGIMAQLD